MVGSLAGSITMVAMNIILMKYAGSDAVAAGAIVLAAQTILSSIYMGYLQGISPVISFYFGAENSSNLKALYKSALITISGMAIVTFAFTFLLARPLSQLYADGSEHVMNMTIGGIKIYAFAFLAMSFNLFVSSFFTALNDGKTSAILTVCRTLVFLIMPLLILPQFFELNGVWMSLPVAEVLSLILSIWYLKHFWSSSSNYHRS